VLEVVVLLPPLELLVVGSCGGFENAIAEVAANEAKRPAAAA
jgi:hypothetical protein